MKDWYTINFENTLLSPALLFYPDRIKDNIQQMLKIAGGADRLRPHIKTFKCKPIIKMQLEAGIHKFKCATLREARMLAEIGVTDILLAYPLIGPAQDKYLELCAAFPDSQFSVLIDHPTQVAQWKEKTAGAINVYIDLNVGMNRTGINPNEALSLLSLLDYSFVLKGWHIYDGHIHASDLQQRRVAVARAFQSVESLISQLEATQIGELVCGGSISFSIHAKDPKRTLSPGTTLLWDEGYSHNFPDLAFKIAACLATRIISKPDKNRLCLDLGHKAVASEMEGASALFPQLKEYTISTLSEEHMVLETPEADQWEIGALLYAYPWHICPSVALHEKALIVAEGGLHDQWDIESRQRIYL